MKTALNTPWSISQKDKWPFRLYIKDRDGNVVIGYDLPAYSTSDTLEEANARPENESAFALLEFIVAAVNACSDMTATWLKANNVQDTLNRLISQRDALRHDLTQAVDTFPHGFWLPDALDTLSNVAKEQGEATDKPMAYNTPGHVCPETFRVAMTVADFCAKQTGDLYAYLYNTGAAAIGRRAWRLIEFVDSNTEVPGFFLDFADGSYQSVPPDFVIYVSAKDAANHIADEAGGVHPVMAAALDPFAPKG